MSELSTHPHPLGILAPSQAAIEAVGSGFLQQGLLRAREKTISALHEIRARLKEGLTEDDARRIALDVFSSRGVTKHWHKPIVRFGFGTTLTFHAPLQPEYRLKTVARKDAFFSV